MENSLFFHYFSTAFKKVENKINAIINRIKNGFNTNLIPLLAGKKYTFILFNELRIEFRQFIWEEKMRENVSV